jgi:hypothetical protein
VSKGKSSTAWFSKHRDLYISVAVVSVLLVAGVFVADGFNANTLRRYAAAVRENRAAVDASLSQRFDLAEKLLLSIDFLDLAGREEISKEIEGAIASYHASADDTGSVSQAYLRLDDALSDLLRELVAQPSVQTSEQGKIVLELLKSLAGCEDALARFMAQYEEAATAFNRRLDSFPMNLSAKRRAIVAFPHFSIQDALQTRP